MKNFTISCTIGILWLLLLTSCDDDDTVDSSSVETREISAEIHVRYDGQSDVNIETMLREGPINSNTDVFLVDGDELRVSTLGDLSGIHYSDDLFDNLIQTSDQDKVMALGERTVYGERQSGIWYQSRFDPQYRSNVFTVSFRGGARRSAPNSTVELPPDFNITAPLSGMDVLYSRSMDTVQVSWEPANTGFAMDVVAHISCVNGSVGTWSTGNIIDNASYSGVYDIPPNTFSGYTGECGVTVSVERSRLGAIDPAYGQGGYIRGLQYRTVAINTID